MKVLRKSINVKSGMGYLTVEAEESDDMYHLYNLISVGDSVEATTVRNVVTESKSGARDKTRVQTKIMIRVEDIEFDADDCSLRLKGANIKENEHLKLGQYHTLTLELHRPCEISKDTWDSVHLEVIASLEEPAKGADLAVLVMQEGLANLCLIRSALTHNFPKIERDLPKSRQQGNAIYEKAVSKFYGDMYEALKRHVDLEVVKVVLLGSPGFTKDDFLTYLNQRAVQENFMSFIKNKSKFVKSHCSSGQRRAVAELLGSPEVLAQVGEVRAAGEVRALQTFHAMLAADPDRACYGAAQVFAAQEQLAVAELLISDTLYRAKDFAERRRYVQLMEAVRAAGGSVFQFSSLHCSGEQLNLYTGIAATLRFPLPEVVVVQEEDVAEDAALLLQRREEADGADSEFLDFL